MSCEGKRIEEMSLLDLRKAQLDHMQSLAHGLRETASRMRLGLGSEPTEQMRKDSEQFKILKQELELRINPAVIPEAFNDSDLNL